MKRKRRFEFPPDVFWIKPNGQVMPVIGHLTAMQAKPEDFGLPAAPTSDETIDKAFTELWEEGWTRGRYGDGVLHIQMGEPAKTQMEYVRGLVEKHADQVSEVDVDFAHPVYWRMGKVLSATAFVQERWPIVWGLGNSRG
jgi:hypothetical protein